MAEPWEVVSVVEAGKGYLIVKKGDNSTVKREGGTVAWRCHNPGNIKYGAFAEKHGAIGEDYGGHAVFPTWQHGHNALKALIFGDTYGKLTIKEAMKRYAPSSDNNDPEVYAKYIAGQHASLSLNTVLGTLNEELQETVVKAIETFEGFKEGTVTEL